MKGYPDYFATKEDYENIMRDFPKWRKRVKEELKALKAIKGDKVLRAIAPVNPEEPEGEWITEEIPNPLPKYKQKGFKTKKKLNDLISEVEAKEKQGQRRKWLNEQS